MNSNARFQQALHRAVSHENDGELFEAEQIFRQLTRRKDVPPHASYQYAQLLLRRGDYLDAWPHFMERLKDPEYTSRSTSAIMQPYLDPTHLAEIGDKSVLVYCDQGIGDALMCARFIPRLADAGAKVFFVVFEGFRDLFASLASEPSVTVLEYGDPLPKFDFHADLFSLPAIFETTPATLPDGKWMNADAGWSSHFAEKLAPYDGLKIGLLWQGSTSNNRDAERSAKLTDFAPLLETGHTCVSLQAGFGIEQLDADDAPKGLVTFDEITDGINAKEGRLVSCAALVQCLDLVITVDTAIVHLAGALGKQAWVLVPKVPYWVFMLEGQTTPWYPETRIFRAKERYSWASEIEDMRQILDATDVLPSVI